MNVADLTGVALDWAVAKCEGLIGGPYIYKMPNGEIFCEGVLPEGVLTAPESAFDVCINGLGYSTDWAQGGPIIQRENISVRKLWDGGKPRPAGSIDAWRADLDFKDEVMTLGKFSQYGGTPLEAAMRCYVQSELGDEIEIPKEIL